MVSPVSPSPDSSEKDAGHDHLPSEEEAEVDLSTAMFDDPIVGGSNTSSRIIMGPVLVVHAHCLPPSR